MTKTKSTESASPSGSEAKSSKTQKTESKRDKLIRLLRARNGATVTDLATALEWQPHSVRAALTSLRKTGTQVERLAPRKGERAHRFSIPASAKS